VRLPGRDRKPPPRGECVAAGEGIASAPTPPPEGCRDAGTSDKRPVIADPCLPRGSGAGRGQVAGAGSVTCCCCMCVYFGSKSRFKPQSQTGTTFVLLVLLLLLFLRTSTFFFFFTVLFLSPFDTKRNCPAYVYKQISSIILIALWLGTTHFSIF